MHEFIQSHVFHLHDSISTVGTFLGLCSSIGVLSSTDKHYLSINYSNRCLFDHVYVSGTYRAGKSADFVSPW